MIPLYNRKCSLHNDILGARGAGISAIWLNRYGMPCPDSSLAREITAFEPLDAVFALLSLPSEVGSNLYETQDSFIIPISREARPHLPINFRWR